MPASAPDHGTLAAMTGLVQASTRLHPDDVPAAIAREASKVGLDDVVLLLVDLEQRVLRPFVDRAIGPDDEVSIDGSVPGRAYRTEAPVVGDRVAGRTAVHLPLLDSAERLGVLSATTTAVVDDDAVARFGAFTSLAGEIVANKATYGDAVVHTRRTRPTTLPAELRWSMLPPLTYSGRNVTISAVLEPAYEIAGDTFDYAVNGDVANLVILDAVGHGLEAARIANLAVGAYRHARRRDLDIAGIYAEMDAAVAEQFGPEKFATAQLATLSMADGRLAWLNAGHPPPMVIRQLHRFDLDSAASLPIGIALGGDPPTLATHDLEPGDLVLFFTDGVIEARAASGEQFGRDRLADLLGRAAAASQTPAETVRRLAHAVLDHQEGVLQDDGTLLLLVWHGPAAPLPGPGPSSGADPG